MQEVERAVRRSAALGAATELGTAVVNPERKTVEARSAKKVNFIVME